MATAILTDNGLMLICEWFAKCANPTLTALDHPALGPVPTCARCAEQVGLTDQLLTIKLEGP